MGVPSDECIILHYPVNVPSAHSVDMVAIKSSL